MAHHCFSVLGASVLGAAMRSNVPDKHVHDFKPTTTKVMADKKSKHGFVDTLKQWKCKCGLTQTYDLERKKL